MTRLLPIIVCGQLACSSDAPATDATSSSDADSDAAIVDRGGASDGKTGDGATIDATGTDDEGSNDVLEPPVPRCSFVEPLDGAVIDDAQTRVVLQTHEIASGSVASILVNYEPKKTAIVDAEGIAEFPTVPLPAPSSVPVELRGAVRVSFNHQITCWIQVTVN